MTTRPEEDSGNPPRAPRTAFDRWIQVLGTTGGTALITVVIGGLVGQLLTATIQAGNREGDQWAALLKMRTEQGITMHRRYAEDGLAVLTRGYERIGAVMASAEEVLLIAGDPVWNPKNYPPDEAQRIRDQRRIIRERFTTETATWSREHENLGLQLDYYFGAEDDSVGSVWRDFDATMDSYLRCVYSEYTRSNDPTRPDPGCRVHKQQLTDRLQHLSRSLRDRRVYLWKGWETELESATTARSWWRFWAHGPS